MSSCSSKRMEKTIFDIFLIYRNSMLILLLCLNLSTDVEKLLTALFQGLLPPDLPSHSSSPQAERVSRHVWNSLNALSSYQTYPRWFFSKSSWKSSLFHCQEMTGPPLSGLVVLTFGKRPETQFLQSVVVYAFLPWRMLWWKKTFRDWEVPKTKNFSR